MNNGKTQPYFLGIIDLGTNSVRLEIFSVSEFLKVQRVANYKKTIRFGSHVFTEGELGDEAIVRAMNAFQEISDLLERHLVDRVIAFGTSALRNASNGEAFLAAVKTEFGISIEVISGEEEAELIAQGILHNEVTPYEYFLLVDIGGGSTEISLCHRKNLIYSWSTPMGTIRFQKRFLKTSPPEKTRNESSSSIDRVRARVHELMAGLKKKHGLPPIDTIIASSGTPKAIRKIFRQTGLDTEPFRKKELAGFVKEIASMDRTMIRAIPGMEKSRVDLILPGSLILQEIMESVGARKVFVTDYSLRHGILEREVSRLIRPDA